MKTSIHDKFKEFVSIHGPKQVNKLREELNVVKNIAPKNIKFYRKITDDIRCDLMIFAYVPGKIAVVNGQKASGIQWRYLGDRLMPLYALGDVQIKEGKEDWTVCSMLTEYFSLEEVFKNIEWQDDSKIQATLIDQSGEEIPLS